MTPESATFEQVKLYIRKLLPGGQFTIAAGFRGLWENLGTVRKTYVTWAPA